MSRVIRIVRDAEEIEFPPNQLAVVGFPESLFGDSLFSLIDLDPNCSMAN